MKLQYVSRLTRFKIFFINLVKYKITFCLTVVYEGFKLQFEPYLVVCNLVSFYMIAHICISINTYVYVYMVI